MMIENLQDRVRESADFILCQEAKIGPIFMGQSDIDQVSDAEAAELFNRLVAVSPVPVRFNGRLKRCYGRCGYTYSFKKEDYQASEIEISKLDRSWAERVKTLAHEITHAILHAAPLWPGRLELSHKARKDEKELEAELSAFIVADILGLPQLVYSENYIFGFYKAVPSGLNILRARWAAAEILKRI